MTLRKFLNYFLISIVILIFLKTDYRIISEILCCGDDHDYFIHAETISKDFDLDYSNQLINNESARFKNGNKLAPIGFIGSGIFSAPFLFIGTLVESSISKLGFSYNKLFNFEIMFYSFSSVFYYFLTYFLIIKILRILRIQHDPKLVLLFYYGSGLAYYAFERYSMTHVYEAFSSTLIIYISILFYQSPKKNNIYSFLVPIAIMLGIMVKWVNYYLLVLPYLIKKFFLKDFEIKNKYLINKMWFLGSSIICLIIFLAHSKALYGKFTFNPQFVYGTKNGVYEFLVENLSFKDLILNNIINGINILFSKEFGIFWFSPVLFFGVLFSIINFIYANKNSFLINLVLLSSFFQVLAIVLMWKSTASSYGYRYLFTLIPISILLSSKFINKTNLFSVITKYYLIIFSVFSMLSILFFETSPRTQLSNDLIKNSFGIYRKFSQPEYLEGYIESIFIFDSYIKIFLTSFLGLFFIKILILIFGYENFLNIIEKFIVIENRNSLDFYLFIDKINQVEISKLITSFLIIFCFSIYIYKYTKNKIN